MGKNLKFPKRGKYVPHIKRELSEPEKKEEPVSEEEHQKRIELLKRLGVLK
jgi:hypothetical protein